MADDKPVDPQSPDPSAAGGGRPADSKAPVTDAIEPPASVPGPDDAVAAFDRTARKRRMFPLRGDVSLAPRIVAAVLCVGLVFGTWWFVTRQEAGEERIMSPLVLPSIPETFRTFPVLWNPEEESMDLFKNLWVSLRRVCLGFALAAAIGVPLGVLAGCFRVVEAFLSPLIMFGRNIPIAAITVLTFALFGTGELQKIMFILVACIAFIMADSCQGIRDIAERYVDTARTLGASSFQTIYKVLVPLALPRIANSLRLLFGLAFGYIMLVELVKDSGVGGLGFLLSEFRRRGPLEGIYLIIIVIPIVAFAIDRLLFLLQCMLFEWNYRDEAKRSAVVRAAFVVKRMLWRAPAGS